MLKVGVIGIGFMGKTHFEAYNKNQQTKVVAIADVNEKKLKGDWSEIGGNIGDANAKNVNLSEIRTCNNPDDLINDPNIDLVDICLPTNLHAEYAIKSFRSGKNVMCEKPMARNKSEAQKMITAWKKSKKKFMVGHCIRFWPGYDLTAEFIKTNKFGNPRVAILKRVSTLPIWSWDNWLLDDGRSGGCALDMHIHDIDAATFFFGKPAVIDATGVVTDNRVDHIISTLKFETGTIAVIEGRWEKAAAFPFNMTFTITFNSAVVEFDLSKANKLIIYHNDGKKEDIDLPNETGWEREINYFVDCIIKDKDPDIVTPFDAKLNLELALKEISFINPIDKRVSV